MDLSVLCEIISSIQSFNCGICLEEKQYDNRFTINGCSHFYCSDCISKYVELKLNQKIVRIRCPDFGCSGQLDPEHCRSIIAHQVFDKWSKALITQVPCKKYAPDKREILLHKLAETMKWKQCPGCNIYIEKKVAQRRQWSGEEAELDPAYKLKFVRDEILDQSSESCNSMHCRWCGCNFCYECGVSYDDPKGHDSRRNKCDHAYVPPLIGTEEKMATMKNVEDTSTMKNAEETSAMKNVDEMSIMKSAYETSTVKIADEMPTMKSVPSPWWKGVQVTYFSDCKDISELVPGGISYGGV